MVAPGGDTWQDDLSYGKTSWTKSRGDTCHHCKGDTWHGMTSAADMAGLTEH
jgi:hypothetical protein